MKIIDPKKLPTTNGGGGKSAPPPPPPPAPPPPPPPDEGTDPALQAEIEKQRALRAGSGQIPFEEELGSGTTTEEQTTKKTLLGQ